MSTTTLRANSRRLFERAQAFMPGGVNSPVRAFKAVGGTPVFMAKGAGARVTDADGNEYIDYLGSWGPLILGHCAPAVVEAIETAARAGTSFGAPTAGEADLAELIVAAIPSVEKIRMVNSGTEATLSALRLARAVTGRDLIIKMDGCYHGHVDSLLVKAGSGVATLGIPGSPGVPEAVAAQTLTAPYNDASSVERLFDQHKDAIACVIVEPVAGNMGVIPPAEGYLQSLREITSRNGALLIVDEVMTGFRVAHGGAQVRFGIEPDITTLGKVIGGGLPVGAYGGPASLMARIAPEGDVYQAGTLSGNPLAMAAGIATLSALAKGDVYDRLENLSNRLASGLREAASDLKIPIVVNQVGAMMSMFFTADPVVDFAGAATSDTERFVSFFNGMLDKGINLAPSPYEALFVSAAHTVEDIDLTLAAARETLTHS